jgi:hypothetical protein
MTAFEAKDAGTLAEENMRKMAIDWLTYEGGRIPYRSAAKGEHYRLIVEAMRAKLEQNPKVREILLATGTLVLRPGHTTEPGEPPEWRYNEVWRDGIPRPSGTRSLRVDQPGRMQAFPCMFHPPHMTLAVVRELQ